MALPRRAAIAEGARSLGDAIRWAPGWFVPDRSLGIRYAARLPGAHIAAATLLPHGAVAGVARWPASAVSNEADIFAVVQLQQALVVLATIALAGVVVVAVRRLMRRHRPDCTSRLPGTGGVPDAAAARLAAIVRNARDMIIVMDDRGWILEANARALATYGYTLDELRSMPPGGLCSPASPEVHAEQMKEFDAPGGIVFECVHCRKDGSKFPVEVSGSAFEFEGRRFRLGICRDISLRHGREQQIQRLNRLYAALSHVNQAIVRSRTRDELFQELCRVLVEHGKFRMVWIGWRDLGSEQVRPLVSYGDDNGYLADIRIYADDRLEGHGPTGTAIREERPCVCNDFFSTSATVPWQERAARHGFAASIALPIRFGGRVMGALNVYAAEKHFFGDREIELLEEAATDVSFALDNLERTTLRKQTEDELRVAHERLRCLVDANIVGIVIATSENKVIEANDYCLQLTGFSREDVQAGAIDRGAITPPEWRTADQRAEAELRERGACTPYEKEFLRRDGLRVPVLVAETRLPGPEELIAGFVLDLSQRKQADRRIREQAELLDKAGEAIVVADLENQITFWSRGAERLFGWAASEMIGRPVGEVFSGLSSGVIGDVQAHAAFEIMGDWRGEIRSRNRQGDALNLETSVTVLRDENGGATGRLSISTDITEKKRLEEQFLRAQRLESIGMLAAGIAHDLNNILAPISMATPMLRANATVPSDLRLLDTLETCVERGTGLVRQILGFAHGIGGEMRLVQVKHLLRDVVGIMSETFPKSIVLDVDVPNDLWTIVANPTQIHQVLFNLCVNARDAMPRGGTLTLRAANRMLEPEEAARIDGGRAGAWLVMHVEDTGMGIAPEMLPRIWDPFFTTKDAGKGTGLGLSTARGIVENHRGFVTVQSEVGVGSAFRVFLPAAEAAGATESGGHSLPAGRGNGELILLVDDEAPIRDAASAILTRQGYRVVTACDGADAAEHFTKYAAEFALVITDVDMPNVDGEDLARSIAASRPGLKLLAMSGLNSRDTGVKPEEFADAFLAKPFTADALLQQVERLLAPPPLPPSN